MPVLLNHTKIGTGPELVILHGLFGSSSNWRTIANKLADDFTVYALDARNHGDSPWSDSMTYQEMAEDIAHFLDAQQIQNTNVIGHSMGGKTAMTFALNFPDRLNKLVIADITPKAYSHGDSHKYYIDTMRSLDLNQLSGRKQADLFLAEKLNEPKPIIQFLLQNLVFKNEHYSWRINLPVLDQSLTTIMGPISTSKSSKHPSLFLHGKNSNYVQPADHALINSVFENAVIKDVDNAGHWLHAEQPEQFTRLVKQFLTPSSGKI